MRVSLLFCFLIIFVVILGCSKKGGLPKTWEESRDSSYLQQRFKIFSSIEKSQWEIKTIQAGGLGPGSYKIRGYFHVSSKESEKIEKDFEWLEVERPIVVSFKLDSDWPKPEKWFYSKEFNGKVKTSSWGGEVYFSPMYSLFYFCLEN